MNGRGYGPPSRNAASRYLEDKIATASPAELVGMLYDAVLANTKLGIAALETGDKQEASRRFMKAQDVVMELRASLNVEAGDMAAQLDSLYAWIFEKLVQASISNDVNRRLKAANEAYRCIEPIVSAWAEATRATRGG